MNEEFIVGCHNPNHPWDRFLRARYDLFCWMKENGYDNEEIEKELASPCSVIKVKIGSSKTEVKTITIGGE